MLKGVQCEEEKKHKELKVIPEVFIKKITVEEVDKASGHYEAKLRVLGRSRFCYYLLDSTEYNDYEVKVRYSQLEKVDKVLRKLLTKANKKKEKSTLPKKSLFSKKEESNNHLAQFNRYFDSMINTFSNADILPEPLIDLCSPLPINILVMGEKIDVNEYLNKLILEIYNSKGSKTSIRESKKSTTIVPKHDPHAYRSKKSFWKLYCPIDYWVNKRMFRLDFVNLYFGSKHKIELMLGYSDCVIITVNPERTNWLSTLDKQFSMITNYNKMASKEIKLVIVTISMTINSEMSNGIVLNVRSCYEKKFVGTGIKMEIAYHVNKSDTGFISSILMIITLLCCS